MAPQASDQTGLPKRKRKDGKHSSKRAGTNKAGRRDNDKHKSKKDTDNKKIHKSKRSKGSGKGRTKTTKQRPTHDPIMALPYDLRHMIYEELLVSEYGQVPLIGKNVPNGHKARLGDAQSFQKHIKSAAANSLVSSRPDTSDIQKPKNLDPILLRLNKTYNAETKAILYSRNKFTLEDMRTLFSFSAMIGRDNCQLLKRLSLRNCGNTYASQLNNYTTFTLLGANNAVNLTRIDIDCRYPPGSRFHPDRVASSLFSDAQYLLQEVARAAGKWTTATDLFHFGPRSVADDKTHQTTEAIKQADLAMLNNEVPPELEKLMVTNLGNVVPPRRDKDC
ncbi:MAG: hypothetical protein Q9174_004983 [Haloplaca sp. 1 TL-2023]